MEQSVHKRVYINPNFKRAEAKPWPAVSVKTTHFNRHYLEELPNKLSNPPTLNNRKIFVNPNFINSNSMQSKPMTNSGYYVQPNENLNSTSTGYLVQQNKSINLTSTGYVQSNENFNSTCTGYYVQRNENLSLPSPGYHVQPNKNINVTNTTRYVQPNENLNSTSTGYHVQQNKSINLTSTGYVQSNENLNCNNVSNNYLLHKSKYSLVKNIQQTVVNKEPAKIEMNKNNPQITILESCQNNKKITQEVPLTLSRYCIVRRKKRSINSEYKSVKNTVIGSAPTVPITNQLTCYSHVIQNNIRKKLNRTTMNRVTKVKITKYKTVQINYKKNPATGIDRNKFVASPLKSYLKRSTKLNSSLITCNKNRYKFIKTSTPVSTVKATKIAQYKEKVIKSYENKVKLSRSIRAKFNINNIPCRLFTKYGQCLRQNQGNCKYLHDKKHISLCRKFLKGICHDKNCTLSHELTDKKMPTCYFYLKGMCTKEYCPYLHVKLSDKTKICQEFARGYCENGDKCLFRHVNIDKIKKAKKISLNNLHTSLQDKVTRTKQQQRKEKVKTESCDAIKILEETVQKDDEDCRYYKELVNSDDSYEIIKPTRCKLGTLPSFIQLG